MEILQPGGGPIPDGDYLPARTGEVFWGRLPCAADDPVATIDSGSSITIDTISHEGVLEDQGKDPLAFFSGHGVDKDAVLEDAIEVARSVSRDPGSDGPHLVTGPIKINGAEPGDLIKITMEKLTPRVPYGVISNRHGRGALPGEYPLGLDTYSAFAFVDKDSGGTQYGCLPLIEGGEEFVRFPLHPFLGIVGVMVAGTERPHSVPPGPYGGNIDINLLTEGASLYLPVQVPGAGVYVGDPHFAQGDGEVALTAMEASLRATVGVEVIRQADALEQFGEVVGPLAETSEFLVPTGLDVDLDVAVQNCVRAAIGLLRARYGMDPSLAYAYLSAATDFNISQVVDLVKGVHARIRVADFQKHP